TRSRVRVRRSTMASEVPASRALATSSALASRISRVRTWSASAIASRASSLGARGSGASCSAAPRARYAARSTGDSGSGEGSEGYWAETDSELLMRPAYGQRRRSPAGFHPARHPGAASVRVHAAQEGGRIAEPLRDPLVVRGPVDHLQADDLPGRELGAGLVLAPQAQRQRGGVVQVAGL